MNVCVPCVVAKGGQEKASDPLELDSQMVLRMLCKTKHASLLEPSLQSPLRLSKEPSSRSFGIESR